MYMRRTYGESFQYQDFAPLFRCENFDAAEWAALFRASGAQGLTMTSKHHEGWTLWAWMVFGCGKCVGLHIDFYDSP